MIATLRQPMACAAPAAIVLAALVLAPAVAAAADAGAGQAAFVRQCALCHTVTKDGPNRFGPNLFGIVGRPAGSVQGFNYSSAFKSTAAWTWNADTLAGFISKPAEMVPGTTMGVFQGVADRDRDNLVAYLTAQK
jgi:cytochrome c